MLRATTYFKVLTSGMLKRHLQQGSVPSHKTATCAHNLLQTLSHSVLKIDQKHVQHYVSIIAAFIYMYLGIVMIHLNLVYTEIPY